MGPRSPNRRLGASQAQLFQRATALLREGRAPQALVLARQLATDAPGSADAQQLLGMCLAEAGDPAAERAFRSALTAEYTTQSLGFRCARDAHETP